MSYTVDEYGTDCDLVNSSTIDAASGSECKTLIQDKAGTDPLWVTVWAESANGDESTWIFIRPLPEPDPYVFRRTRGGPKESLFTDNDHCVIFPQDEQALCPSAWIQAAWPFIAHFRSNFTLYPQLAFFYRKVTIIGHPLVKPSVSQQLEYELRELGGPRQVERIYCHNEKELAHILNARIVDGTPFVGEDQGDIYSKTAK
jgi:hypothetical protein